MNDSEFSIDALDDQDSAKSLYELLTPAMQNAINRLPSQLTSLDPDTLLKEARPTLVIRRLKSKLWSEYSKCLAQGDARIGAIKIYDGICTRQYFYKNVLEVPRIFAWIISPVASEDAAAREALEFGLERLRNEVLTADLMGDDGRLDTDAARIVISVVKFLEAKIHGNPLQRIEQKSLHAHVHSGEVSFSKEDLMVELDRIKDKLDRTRAPMIEARVSDVEEN